MDRLSRDDELEILVAERTSELQGDLDVQIAEVKRLQEQVSLLNGQLKLRRDQEFRHRKQIELLKDTLADNYWMWQEDDSENYLESLVIPVVIQPGDLIDIINRAKKP